jgi:hypothetical protein
MAVQAYGKLCTNELSISDITVTSKSPKYVHFLEVT